MAVGQLKPKIADTPLIEEWDWRKNNYEDPTKITIGSQKYIWWKCESQHSWKTKVHVRAQGFNCPYCSGRKPILGVNDLQQTNPEIASYWHPERNHPTTIDEVMRGTRKTFWWRCAEGHEWRSAVAKMRENSCKTCKSFGFKRPEMLKEWNSDRNIHLDPFAISAMNSRKVWWKCSKNHEFKATIASKSLNSCPVCTNQKIVTGFNDLATTHPALAEQWDFTKNELGPKEVSYGSKKSVWWICARGHSWKSSPSSRTYKDKVIECRLCSEAGVSKVEQKVFDYVTSVTNKEILRNERILERKEIDIFIPALKLGLEVNGNFWHSNEFILKTKSITSFEFHSLKRNTALVKGIKLYFVWQHDWELHKEIIERSLKNLIIFDIDNEILHKLEWKDCTLCETV